MIWDQARRLILLFTAITTPAALAAQEPTPQLTGSGQRSYSRDGMWFSAGLGTGLGEGGVGGLTANFAAGWAVSPRVSLAVGSSDWRLPFDRTTLTMGTLDLRAQFYPEVNAGFFLTGGLGLGFFRFDDSGTGADIGRGFVLGLGYDARVGENTSFTTFINRVAVHTADPRASGIQLGVGLTFH
jgi:hypothetical protein